MCTHVRLHHVGLKRYNLSRQAGEKFDQNLIILDTSESDRIDDEQLAKLLYGDLPEIDDILPPS